MARTYDPVRTYHYGECIIASCERNCVSHRENYCHLHVKMRREDKEAFSELPRNQVPKRDRKPRSDAGIARGPYKLPASDEGSEVFGGKSVEETLRMLRERVAADREAGIPLG